MIELRPKDRFFFFTDGINEASDADGQEFNETSIATFVNANASFPASELSRRLLTQVTAQCSAQSQDDATLPAIDAM